jgi:hypothetical protein
MVMPSLAPLRVAAEFNAREERVAPPSYKHCWSAETVVEKCGE